MSGTLHDLAALVLLALAVAGCGPSTRDVRYVDVPGPTVTLPAPPEIGDQAPHVRTQTPRGVQVDYPVWLDLHPADLAAALDEVDTVTPEADARIDPAHRGVPVGALVVILDPGAYYAPGSPTGLAGGEWHGSTDTLYVAWRGTSSGVRLPGLPHELRHHLTGDPLAGHGP